MVTFNQSVFWCSPQIFESAKWKTNCDLLVVTLSAGSAASFLHLHLLVFISRFVGRRGVRKGEKKNHLKCIFPRTIFLGHFSGDSHLYFILYPHSYLESFLQKAYIERGHKNLCMCHSLQHQPPSLCGVKMPHYKPMFWRLAAPLPTYITKFTCHGCYLSESR